MGLISRNQENLVRAVAGGIVLIASAVASAQAPPIQFSSSTKQAGNVTSSTSPASVVFNGSLYVYYCDESTGQLFSSSSSSPGANLTNYFATGVNCGNGGSLSATVYNGAVYLVGFPIYPLNP